MGAGLLKSDWVIIPGVGYSRFIPKRFIITRHSRKRYRADSIIIKKFKLYQTGIDGVGEYCGKHCLPQSQRRFVFLPLFFLNHQINLLNN